MLLVTKCKFDFEVKMALLVVFLHLAATLFMTGVIWFVQVVHYPLILFVPSSSRITYCKTNAKRTSFVVLPPMLVELGTAIAMCFLASGSIYWFVNLLLLTLIWMSTFLIQVPLHNHLGQKTEDSFVERLVATNWIRTALWTLRSVMLLIWLYAAFGSNLIV